MVLVGDYDAGDAQWRDSEGFDSSDKGSQYGRIFSHDWLFRFNGRDTVIINKEFGLYYLGDTIYQYKINSMQLVLTNGNTTLQIPVESDNGIVRLYIRSKEIERISIIKVSGDSIPVPVEKDNRRNFKIQL